LQQPLAMIAVMICVLHAVRGCMALGKCMRELEVCGVPDGVARHSAGSEPRAAAPPDGRVATGRRGGPDAGRTSGRRLQGNQRESCGAHTLGQSCPALTLLSRLQMWVCECCQTWV